VSACANCRAPAAHVASGGGIDAAEPFCCECVHCEGGELCDHYEGETELPTRLDVDGLLAKHDETVALLKAWMGGTR
jgi:hypothetical protein